MNMRHRNAPLPTNVYLTSEKLIWTKDTTFVVSSDSMTCRPISRSTPVYEFIESISVCHCVFPTLKARTPFVHQNMIYFTFTTVFFVGRRQSSLDSTECTCQLLSTILCNAASFDIMGGDLGLRLGGGKNHMEIFRT